MSQQKSPFSKSNNHKSNENTHQISEDIRKLALARLKAMPNNLKVSIGSSEYTKDDILDHVEKGDAVGQQVASIQIDFIRSLASGSIYDYNEQKTLTSPKNAQQKNPHHTPQP